MNSSDWTGPLSNVTTSPPSENDDDEVEWLILIENSFYLRLFALFNVVITFSTLSQMK